MMHIDKFPYKELSRVHDDHGRFYNVGESRPLPSVTTIIGKTTDHTWLDEWRERVGDEEADRIVEESLMIGNGMHDLLEQHYTGCEVGKVPPISRIFADTIKRRGLSRVSEVWGVEAPLYFPKVYAGASDLVAVHDDKPSIVDYKNSRRDKTEEEIYEYKIQSAAYGEAHNELYGTDIKRAVIMMMCRSGTYMEFILEGKEYQKARDEWWRVVETYYENYGIIVPK